MSSGSRPLGCIATGDGKMLGISDLGSRGFVLSSEIKGADQLYGYRAADLRFCFCLCKSRFCHYAAQKTLTIRILKWFRSLMAMSHDEYFMKCICPVVVACK